MLNNPYWLVRFIQQNTAKCEGWFGVVVLLVALVATVYAVVVNLI